MRCHHGLHLVLIDQHDARAAHWGVSVSCLHQLPAGRVERVRAVPAFEFFRQAHVKNVGSAAVVKTHFIDLARIHKCNAVALGNILRMRLRASQCIAARRGREIVRTLGDFKPRQVPAHRAIFERVDRVFQACVTQALCADDGARAPGAIDHNGGFFGGHQTGYAIHQLSARAIACPGDAHHLVFIHRARINDDHVAAFVLPLLEHFGINTRCVVFMLDHLAKRFGRHEGAGEHLVTRCRPSLDATLQHREIEVAVVAQHLGGTLREVVAVDFCRVVHQNDAHVAARQQSRRLQLQRGKRQVGSREQVALGEYATVTHVDQGQLFAIGQHGAQGTRTHVGRIEFRLGHKALELPGLDSGEKYALGELRKRTPVEVQVQSGTFRGDGNRMKIVRQKTHRVALFASELPALGKLATKLDTAVVYTLVADIVFVARNPRKYGPRRVVVRRHSLAWLAGGGVERVAPIMVHRQFVNRAVLGGTNTEVLQGEQLGL